MLQIIKLILLQFGLGPWKSCLFVSKSTEMDFFFIIIIVIIIIIIIIIIGFSQVLIKTTKASESILISIYKKHKYLKYIIVFLERFFLQKFIHGLNHFSF